MLDAEMRELLGFRPPARRSVKRSFTLMEMMVVVFILATLAGMAAMLTGGIQDQVSRDLALKEAYAIRDAVLRFQADTGCLPGEGPFDVVSRGGGVTDPSNLQWFDSAANLDQLVRRPVLTGAFAALANWDVDRRRGWNGPYLSMDGEGEVRVGYVNGRVDHDEPNPPATEGPGLEDAAQLDWAAAVADPFTADHHFEWRSFLDPSQPLARQGHPFLLILPRDAQQRVRRDFARVVGLGSNGRFDPHPDPPELPQPRDDLVVYLFR